MAEQNEEKTGDKVKVYSKGDHLFLEGDKSQELYIIQSGSVKIYKKDGDKIFPIAVVGAGQFIGELSFFDGLDRSATAEAATEVRAIKITKEEMDKVLKVMPSWMLTLIRSIALRVRHADEVVKRNGIEDSQLKVEFDKLK